MNTIVMNTLNAAVTEYDWTFQSITPSYAGDVTGLYAQGGDSDNGAAINASIYSGRSQWNSALKKRVDSIYAAIVGAGSGVLHVNEYSYPIVVGAAGETRASPGKGIRENYLTFGYSNTEGADFRLDKLEILIAESHTRRV